MFAMARTRSVRYLETYFNPLMRHVRIGFGKQIVRQQTSS